MTKVVKTKKGQEGKPRTSAQQKKLHRQQIVMSLVGVILVLAMVLSLVMNY